MSFILDALKKSESDRQRQSGPALYEVRVAPPRAGLPLWAVAIAALLAINLGIVLWMLLRSNAREAGAPAPMAPPAATAAPTPLASPVPAAALPAPPVAASAPAAASVAAPPAPAPAVSQAPVTAPAPAAGTAEEPQNPQDYAPAQESSAPASHVRRASAAGVPLYQDAAATPGTQIPQLHLDFHMYSPQPQDRFVMINMHKLREGDSLPEGVHVNSITPDGAVLSYNGQTFMLPRE
jgi:general secretion pathway protein B